MPTYTMTVTVDVWAETPREAVFFVTHALGQAKKQEVIFRDADITETVADDELPLPPARLAEIRADIEDRRPYPWQTWRDRCAEVIHAYAPLTSVERSR